MGEEEASSGRELGPILSLMRNFVELVLTTRYSAGFEFGLELEVEHSELALVVVEIGVGNGATEAEEEQTGLALLMTRVAASA